jgi:hypothetical protein
MEKGDGNLAAAIDAKPGSRRPFPFAAADL